MGLLSSHRVSRVLWYSGTALASHSFRLRDFHPLRSAFPDRSTTRIYACRASLPRIYFYTRFGLFPFRSPLLRKSFLLSFPPGNEMFQFPRFPPHILFYSYAGDYIAIAGFPHSDICGSMFICNSPQLFAACHVLLRRLVPRHPPYALSSLI